MIKFQERDSIAQKLHDSLGHTITGSIMQLEAAELLFDDEPKRAKEIMLRVSGTLKDGLAAIRLT
jgi:signal transduction histidine kinase